jgi:hypothetical protein
MLAVDDYVPWSSTSIAAVHNELHKILSDIAMKSCSLKTPKISTTASRLRNKVPMNITENEYVAMRSSDVYVSECKRHLRLVRYAVSFDGKPRFSHNDDDKEWSSLTIHMRPLFRFPLFRCAHFGEHSFFVLISLATKKPSQFFTTVMSIKTENTPVLCASFRFSVFKRSTVDIYDDRNLFVLCTCNNTSV